MPESQLHSYLVLATIALAVLIFVVLFLITAPYGRHERPGWGPTISARAGWLVMESPAVLLFAAIFFAGDHALGTTPLVFLAMWQFHYIYRNFVFPFRLRATHKQTPLLIVAFAVLFNGLNAYINARWVSHLGVYSTTWLTSAPFIAGVVCFVAGWLINQRADGVLFRLRRPGETGYRIPHGGVYRWVSCPNYLGEILEWTGWAIATWSLAGTAFAVFTFANLLPRAIAHHRWYRSEFDEYPASRRAIFPYLL